MLGIVGLDEHAPGELATTGATGSLREKLKRAFGGTEVGERQRGISGDDAHQGYSLKVVALRQHLGANKNVQRAVGERAQGFLILLLGAHGVAVQPRDPCSGKLLAQALLQMLRALAKKIDILRIALGASLWHRLDKAAIMAFQAVAAFLVSHPEASVPAIHRSAPTSAKHRPRIAPATGPKQFL